MRGDTNFSKNKTSPILGNEFSLGELQPVSLITAYGIKTEQLKGYVFEMKQVLNHTADTIYSSSCTFTLMQTSLK